MNKTISLDSLRRLVIAPLKRFIDAKIETISDLVGDTSVSSQISNAMVSKSDVSHIHDERYYTESEIDDKLSTKADENHTHENDVITLAEIDEICGSVVEEALSQTDIDELQAQLEQGG